MKYQVWTKEYTDQYKRADCPDLKTALVSVLAEIKAGKEPLLTQEVLFDVSITIKEEKPSEAEESEAKRNQGAGGESHGEVRRGDEGAPPEINQGSGDNRPGPGAGNQQ